MLEGRVGILGIKVDVLLNVMFGEIGVFCVCLLVRIIIGKYFVFFLIFLLKDRFRRKGGVWNYVIYFYSKRDLIKEN